MKLVMWNYRNIFAAAIAWAMFLPASTAAGGATRYVNPGGAHVSPFIDRASAAKNIQAAIDAGENGDVILVAPGIYETGATNAAVSPYCPGYGPTRVYVSKAVTVRAESKNPADTIIRGQWDPDTTNGPAAVRCVFLAAGARLIGFTLTGGATPGGTNSWAGARVGGGVACGSMTPVISNCIITGNSSAGSGGGASGGVLHDCLIGNNTARGDGGGAMGGVLWRCNLNGNTAERGGGAFAAELRDCALTGNAAARGGGACDSILRRCSLKANRIDADYGEGGGAHNSSLYNCILSGNIAMAAADGRGGGASGGSIYACVISGNTASAGGGTADAELYNCLVLGNLASHPESAGGGTIGGNLHNCVVSGNSCKGRGGGTFDGAAMNSILVNNMAAEGENYFDTSISYSCSIPLPAGEGNIDADPIFVNPGAGYGAKFTAGDFRLQRGSPCVNAGKNIAYMTEADAPDSAEWLKTDMDGDPRIRHGTVDMGAYELAAPGLAPITNAR